MVFPTGRIYDPGKTFPELIDLTLELLRKQFQKTEDPEYLPVLQDENTLASYLNTEYQSLFQQFLPNLDVRFSAEKLSSTVVEMILTVAPDFSDAPHLEKALNDALTPVRCQQNVCYIHLVRTKGYRLFSDVFPTGSSVLHALPVQASVPYIQESIRLDTQHSVGRVAALAQYLETISQSHPTRITDCLKVLFQPPEDSGGGISMEDLMDSSWRQDILREAEVLTNGGKTNDP